MSTMYQCGITYIWQNQTGRHAHLNGQETQVTSEYRTFSGIGFLGTRKGWATETPTPYGGFVLAEPGDLRPKNPPSGERKALELFNDKPVMEEMYED